MFLFYENNSSITSYVRSLENTNAFGLVVDIDMFVHINLYSTQVRFDMLGPTTACVCSQTKS